MVGFINYDHSINRILEPVARLNLWQLEGEEEHKDLLKFALNPSTIQNAMIGIVLDFSQPWNLVASLNRWLQIIEGYLKGVFKQLPNGVEEELKNYRT
jgi:dynein light intermediate chain 1